DVFGAPDALSMPGPFTSQYVNRGLIFSGFPSDNGGGIIGVGAGSGRQDIEGNNFMLFLSAFPFLGGGLPQSPEIITFYPPVAAFQFDTGTFGIDCSDPSVGAATTMALTVQGFSPLGTLVGSTTQPVTIDGATVKLTFTSPVEQVVITTTHTCGPQDFLLHGVELFTMGRVSITPIATPASTCSEWSIDVAGTPATAPASC